MIPTFGARVTRARAARLLSATVVAIIVAAVPGRAGAGGNARSTQQQLQNEQAQLGRQLAAAQTSDAQVQHDVGRLDEIAATQTAAAATAQSQLADAQTQVNLLERQLTDKTTQLAGTEQQLTAARAVLRRQALAAYIEGSSAEDINPLFASNVEQALIMAEYRSVAIGNVSDTVDRLHRVEAVLASQRANLQATESQAQTALAAATDRAQSAAQAALLAQQAAAAQTAAHATLQARIAQFSAESADLAAQQSQISMLIAQSSAQKSAPVVGASPATGTSVVGLVWPLHGTVTSEYGPRWGGFHPGIDIADPTGTPIHAANGGQVIYAGWESGYGNFVLIDHGGGIVTGYAHQSQIAVAQGQSVSQGQVIGYVGSTGDSTGPHLHFETRVNGSPQNPRDYVSGGP